MYRSRHLPRWGSGANVMGTGLVLSPLTRRTPETAPGLITPGLFLCPLQQQKRAGFQSFRGSPYTVLRGAHWPAVITRREPHTVRLEPRHQTPDVRPTWSCHQLSRRLGRYNAANPNEAR